MTDTRVIIFHKHPVSAKVHFIKQAYGGICGFAELPRLATVLEDKTPDDENVVQHPQMIAKTVAQELKVDQATVEVVTGYLQYVDIPGATIKVYLAGMQTHDMPIAALAAKGASPHLITELRGLPPAEMELLQRAYIAIMGG